jgi:hypothetical protein
MKAPVEIEGADQTDEHIHPRGNLAQCVFATFTGGVRVAPLNSSHVYIAAWLHAGP